MRCNIAISILKLCALAVLWAVSFSRDALQAQPIAIANIQRNEPVSFEKDVLPILQRNCLACHNASEKQGDLVLESPDSMRTGGDTGPAVLPGHGGESLFIKLAARQAEPVMPPDGNDVNAKPLTSDELGLVRLWIDQGARGSAATSTLSPKNWQRIAPRVAPIFSLDLTEDGQYLVASRANQLLMYHVPTGQFITQLNDPALSDNTSGNPANGVAHRDLVQSVTFNRDGNLLASGSFREVKIWRRPADVQLFNVATASPIHSLAVSTDRKLLATADASNAIQLWNATSGEKGLQLIGHAAKVTALRFLPDGRLASASLDQTIRVWNLNDGSLGGLIETPSPTNAIEVPFAAPPVEGQMPTPSMLVSGGPDKMLRTWTIPEAAPRKLELSSNQTVLAAVSRDQHLVAMAGSDEIVRVAQRDATGGFVPLTEWKLESGPTRAMTFLTDIASATVDPSQSSVPSQRLATTANDGSVSIWALPNHELIAKWQGALVPSTAIAASNDGLQLATGFENGALSLWRLQIQESQPWPENVGGPVSVYALSPSRSLLAIAGVANGRPAIFAKNLDNGQMTHTLLGHDAPIRSLAFASDNNRIVSGGDDRTIRVWNLGNAQQPEQNKLEGSTASVTAVAFSVDSNQVLSGTADNAVRLWNLADNMPLKDFVGNAGPILGVGFSGNEPFTIAADRSVRFWNAVDGSQIRTYNDQAGTKAYAISPDGQTLALAADDKNIRLYQFANGQLLQTLTGHSAEAQMLGFAADGKRLLSTASVPNQPSESIVWDLAVNPPKMQEKLLQSDVTAAVFDRAADRVLLGDRQGGIRSFALRFVRYLEGNVQAIRALAFHTNGQSLFSASQDGSIRGYTTANGQAIFTASHGAAISALTLSPNEQIFATAGENGIVRLWQANGAPFGPQQLTGFAGPVRAVAFSSSNLQILASGSGDKPTTLVFDLESGQPVQRFSTHQQPVVAFAVSSPTKEPAKQPDQIVSFASDSIWQWSTHATKTIAGHTADITSFAQVPNAPQEIVSGSTDGTIRYWNLSNGQQIRQLNHGGPVTAIAVRPDGQRLASASENHTARLWNLNGQQIAEMRGDVRLKTAVSRLTQQLSAANSRVNVAKQRLDVAEKDVPLKTDAEKKAVDALAAANKDVTDKQAVLDQTQKEKIASEKEAIDAAAASRVALVAKTVADEAHKSAIAAVPIAQQRASQLAAAAGASPSNETLKKAAEQSQQALAAAQQLVQQMQQATQAPAQAAADATAKANAAAEKVATTQKPYNDALAAMKIATAAQNLASQQHVIAARELKTAQELVPIAKQTLAAGEAVLEETKKRLETSTKAASDAELSIRAICFSPDGTMLLTSGDHANLHTWDGETGTALAAYAGHMAPIPATAFLDNDKLISISMDQSVRLWERSPGWRLERTIGSVDQPEVIGDRVMSLDFNADGMQVLVGGGVPSRNGELQIFNTTDGNRVLYLPQAHDDVIYAARFSPDGKRIASAGADKYLRTFDVASSQPIRRFEGHTNYVLGVAWKGDSQQIASASADSTVKIWDSETADQIQTIANFGKHVSQVEFIGETDNIVTSCGDRTVRMHNATNGGNFRNFGGADGWLHCVDIVDDSSVVVAGTDKGAVFIWNGNNGQQLRKLLIGQP
jgi:WD40 repeat protein